MLIKIRLATDECRLMRQETAAPRGISVRHMAVEHIGSLENSRRALGRMHCGISMFVVGATGIEPVTPTMSR